MMSSDQKILIIGGYGTIGGRAAKQLTSEFPEAVVVGGPDAERARAFASDADGGMTGVGIDAANERELKAAASTYATIINTVDSLEDRVAGTAIEAGCNYVGVVGTDLGPLRAKHADAKRTGARVLLGTGVMPGISNVMARSAVDKLGGADRIVTAAVGKANTLGAQTFDYLFREATKPFDLVQSDGSSRRVRPYAAAVPFEFPEPVGTVTSYALNDWFWYQETLQANSVTAFYIQPGALHRSMHLAARAGLTKALASDTIRRWLVSAMVRLTSGKGEDQMLVGVEVSRNGQRLRLSASGDDSAEWTALGVATLASRVHRGEVGPGVWLPEQTIEPAGYLEEAVSRGLKLTEG